MLFRPRQVPSAESEAAGPAAGAARRGVRLAPRGGDASTPSAATSSSDAADAASAAVAAQLGEARELVMETGFVKRAAGSAYVAMGNTKVRCTVQGPRAIKRAAEFGEDGSLACSVSLAPFSQYHLQGLDAREVEGLRIDAEQNLAAALQRCIQGSIRLDRFPKSLLEIDALVLSDDGGAQAAIVACASLALADAGVELFDLVPCVTIGQLKPESRASAGAGARARAAEEVFVVDPDAAQLEACASSTCLALMLASETVTDVTIQGSTSFENVGHAAKQAFVQCVKLHGAMTDHLVKCASAQAHVARQ